jgi:hypothetical protein
MALGFGTQADLDDLQAKLPTASESTVENWRRSLQRRLWEDMYLRPIREVRSALEERGIELRYGG